MKSTSQRVKRSSRHSEGSPAATSMARLSDYFDNDDPADFIQLSVLPDVDLELLRVDSNAASDQGNPDSRTCTFKVAGPDRPLEFLQALDLGDAALQCKASPLSPVTVPTQHREGAGIPIDAASFAFIYPWLSDKLSELNFARDSWAFVLLLGGFAYFSDDGELISVNALTLAPSDTGLMLVGPRAVTRTSLDIMLATQRMESITAPNLTNAGFHRFGWVHPAEKFNGELLGDAKYSYEHGAFIYVRHVPSEGQGPGGARSPVSPHGTSSKTPSASGADAALPVPSPLPAPSSAEAPEAEVQEEEVFFYRLITPDDPLYQRLAKQVSSGSQGRRRGSVVLRPRGFLSSTYEEEKRTSKDAIRAKRAAGDVFKAHEKMLTEVTVRDVVIQSIRGTIYVAIYVAVGLLFYMLHERHECADDIEEANFTDTVSNDTMGADEPSMCPWSTIDTLYFIFATSSTVGYGDMVPSTTLSRFFTVPFMLVGVFVTFTIAGEAVTAFFDFLEDKFARLLGAVARLVLRTEDKEVQDVNAYRVPPAWRFYLGKLGFYLFFGLGTTQFFAAWLFTKLQPGLSFGEAMWHCYVTSTTVGYGESVIDQPLSRALASAHILMSTSWLASFMGRVKQSRKQRQLQVDRAKMLLCQLDEKIVDVLDKDGQGVDQVHFVVGLLTTLGVQLCGEPLNFERDVQPLINRFQALDVKHSGVLTKDDLRFMVKEAQRTHVAAEAAIRGSEHPELTRVRTTTRLRPSLSIKDLRPRQGQRGATEASNDRPATAAEAQTPQLAHERREDQNQWL